MIINVILNAVHIQQLSKFGIWEGPGIGEVLVLISA